MDIHDCLEDSLDLAPTSYNSSLLIDKILLITRNDGQIILVLESIGHLLKGLDFEQGTAIEISKRRDCICFRANWCSTGVQSRLAMNLVLMSIDRTGDALQNKSGEGSPAYTQLYHVSEPRVSPKVHERSPNEYRTVLA